MVVAVAVAVHTTGRTTTAAAVVQCAKIMGLSLSNAPSRRRSLLRREAWNTAGETMLRTAEEMEEVEMAEVSYGDPKRRVRHLLPSFQGLLRRSNYNRSKCLFIFKRNKVSRDSQPRVAAAAARLSVGDSLRLPWDPI